MQKYLKDTEKTEMFGAELYHLLPGNSLIFLQGDLGAGKTTLVRGYLRAAGHAGTVKSPTYNVVEEYVVARKCIYHFDLYRINYPEELEWIGINDYLDRSATCFIEWPDKGQGILPKADLIITFTVVGNGRLVEM